MSADPLHDLHDLLDTVLDVEAGLRDATLARRRSAIDNALEAALDPEAGLWTILPSEPRPRRRGLRGLAGFTAMAVHEPPAARLRLLAALEAGVARATREALHQWERWAAADPKTDVFRTDDEFYQYFAATCRPDLESVDRVGGLGRGYQRSLAHDLENVRGWVTLGNTRRAREVAWSIVRTREDLVHALADFSGVDLAELELESANLAGVRWSSTTVWPPGWAERIRERSVQVAPDLFEVREDPRVDEWVDQVP
ncbi:hypothetical protein [Actinophytocola xanthii]|uniref:Uncharacterized protein n=1 Tax=Actinophytocola xanthii TaxID=1912961 RepID=A0A1Q8CNF0_9PSEU|nr:hypothetical protein [Actinophytocola xanthii]OLF15894.1 hypothetical protein BU204_19475 [Actinophytocola xanthii]